MTSKRFINSVARWMASAIGFATASYAAYVSMTWVRYGKPKPGDVESADALLDLFMPKYEAVDRHKIRVDAPAELALVAATEMDLESSSGGS